MMPAQVADAVAVGVGEAARVDLVDDRGPPPRPVRRAPVGHRLRPPRVLARQTRTPIPASGRKRFHARRSRAVVYGTPEVSEWCRGPARLSGRSRNRTHATTRAVERPDLLEEQAMAPSPRPGHPLYPGLTAPRSTPSIWNRRRRVPRPGRPLGMRQVHLAADARRARRGQRRRDPHRRPRRHPPAAEGPRHRDGFPELRALPAHDRRRQHGLRAEDRRRGQGRDRQRVAGGRRACST